MFVVSCCFDVNRSLEAFFVSDNRLDVHRRVSVGAGDFIEKTFDLPSVDVDGELRWMFHFFLTGQGGAVGFAELYDIISCIASIGSMRPYKKLPSGSFSCGF